MPAMPAVTACTDYVPQIDADGFNWKLWCVHTNGHTGMHQDMSGFKWQFHDEEQGT